MPKRLERAGRFHDRAVSLRRHAADCGERERLLLEQAAHEYDVMAEKELSRTTVRIDPQSVSYGWGTSIGPDEDRRLISPQAEPNLVRDATVHQIRLGALS